MADFHNDLASCSAIVIDSNHTSRSILISQLRDFGVGTVAQASRTSDARKHLEFRAYDFVLCEHHFAAEAMSGQDLLDDLRRNQLLPFSTIFIMITGEATYAKVAEAAKSALDGYLLKPHKAVHLAERLRQARTRKVSLQAIFSAIEEEQFELASQLCMERFQSRGPFWLYAARVGAELLLRLGRYSEAQTLYKAVVDAKTLPWARLGVARAELDAGQITQATSTLENLISTDPSYTDAYDVMGRAQFEAGHFDKALETYKMAAMLTPASVSRLQNLAMITYYAGDHVEAEKLLDRTTRLGLESKMFDVQTLVLLAFTRLEIGDRKGLQRCQDDFARLLSKDKEKPRLIRLSQIVTTLGLLQQHQIAQTIESVLALGKTVEDSTFDFESASNLLTLLAHLASREIRLPEVDSIVKSIGLRFCSNRSLTDLLITSAKLHPLYVEHIRACHAKVLEYSEVAMALSLAGNPTGAVNNLIFHGTETLNVRLIDNAYQVLQRHSARIQDVASLESAIQALRTKSGGIAAKATMGEQKRQPGGLALRTGSPPTQRATTTPTVQPMQ